MSDTRLRREYLRNRFAHLFQTEYLAAANTTIAPWDYTAGFVKEQIKDDTMNMFEAIIEELIGLRGDTEIIELYIYLDTSDIKKFNDSYNESLDIPQTMADEYSPEVKISLERVHEIYTDLYLPLLEKLRLAYSTIVGPEGRPFEQVKAEFETMLRQREEEQEGESRRKRIQSHRKRTRRNRRHKKASTRRKKSRSSRR